MKVLLFYVLTKSPVYSGKGFTKNLPYIKAMRNWQKL